ncbi:CDGSH-type Zn-finger protein [Heliophilum fasciatum]|nr:CDGSH-type Zn-finger protein [Heliophilum fasciatum]
MDKPVVAGKSPIPVEIKKGACKQTKNPPYCDGSHQNL